MGLVICFMEHGPNMEILKLILSSNTLALPGQGLEFVIKGFNHALPKG